MKTNALKISPEMLRLIGEIDEFKGSWRTLATVAPERLALLKKVATIESIGSSTRIEGAKLTDADVEKLLGRLDQQSFVTRDEQEVAGYAEAMDTIFHSHSEIPVTENYIKQLHKAPISGFLATKMKVLSAASRNRKAVSRLSFDICSA
jgi:Fic family protein